ncbi:MinD/ParA family protein [Salisediminibacterium beveridgei]|uniref:Flagellar synthesis regulator FleN n=1 Tax=Salisediminibacterium beveridgei TaxID=632773 RepID=A0A1D7QW18_9BACI|nr:MinD/ParA family protein [Salisediminibacterium beveridgei]AOM83168.1 Flagellar synthesis regulator FleN [Salisediminibacterium beveridgei]
MRDQADALRKKMTGNMNHSTNKQADVIAVVSGKGGVGKSNFTLNFSIGLQKKGKKVLIIDMDIGMANIDILLGQSSTYSIVDMMNEEMSIWSIMEEGPEGIQYIAGGSGLNDLFQMNDMKADHLYRQIESAESAFDYILLDMGAGVNSNSAYFLLSSHSVFLVTTPEPTSVTDAYAMVKYIHHHEPQLRISLIINRSRSVKDGERTAGNVKEVTKKFLGKNIELMSIFPDDNAVWKAVRAQTPFLLHNPGSKPAKAMNETVNIFIAGVTQDETEMKPTFIGRLKGFLRPGS